MQSKPTFTHNLFHYPHQQGWMLESGLWLFLLSRQLKYAREGVSHGGLGLLTKHRKRERLRTLLDMLKDLKTLVGRTVFCQSSLLAEDIVRWLWCMHVCLSSYFSPTCSKERMQSWRSYLRYVLWWAWFAIGVGDLWCLPDFVVLTVYCDVTTVDREIFAIKIFLSTRGATKIKCAKN